MRIANPARAVSAAPPRPASQRRGVHPWRSPRCAGTDDSPAYEQLLDEAKASGQVDPSYLESTSQVVEGGEEKAFLTKRTKAKRAKVRACGGENG